MSARVEEIIESTLEEVVVRHPGEDDFHQSVREVLHTLGPLFEREPDLGAPGLLTRIVEPEHMVQFRVPWIDDDGEVQVNRGARVLFNTALGPGKGGLRFHPSVSLDTFKFLGFEQTFKNALTGFPMGGAKGGADFDPKGRSDAEVMRFCQSFMSGLAPYIGEQTDIPAGDIGVGHRELGYLFGQYRRLTGRYESAALTGKGVGWGGTHVREEATGWGLALFARSMLQDVGADMDGRTCVVSGSGNVAQHAIQRLIDLGATVVACSDSDGVVHDPDGIDLELLCQVKVEERGRVADYAERRDSAEHRSDGSIWDIPCDVALPCATQNELDEDGARSLVENGCILVAEGANMPTTGAAHEVLCDAEVAFGPAKAANAGGVATSAIEIQQNVRWDQWSADQVEKRLVEVMDDIHRTCVETADEYGVPGDYLAGANIAGYRRVAEAMDALGVV